MRPVVAGGPARQARIVSPVVDVARRLSPVHLDQDQPPSMSENAVCENPWENDMSGGPWTRADKIALCSVFVAVAALAISLMQPIAAALTPHPNAEILSPVNGHRVNQESVEIEGRAGDLPVDQDFWLVVRPDVAATFYPVDRLTVQSDGSWAVPDVRLATAGRFHAIVFLASSGASQQFRSYLEENVDNAGLAALPDGASQLDSITIMRDR